MNRVRLDKQLQAAPVATVEGVVGASGVTGAKLGGEPWWTLSVELEAWRIAGGPLQNGSLHLRGKGNDAMLAEHRHIAKPYSVVRMNARLMMDTGSGHPEAWIEDVAPLVGDAGLTERSAQLQRPVTHEDELFGICTLDKRVNWFHAEAPWNGSKIKVWFEADWEALPATLRVAHELWKDAAEWHHRILDCAVSGLLGLKNDTWLDEDEEPISADEFKRRMAIEVVNIDKDGGFSFQFGDDDMFFGHSIMVSGTLGDGPTEANIAG